jgi:hypothetical protein
MPSNMALPFARLASVVSQVTTMPPRTITPLPRIQTQVDDDRDWGVSWLDRPSPYSADLLPTSRFSPSRLPPLPRFERRHASRSGAIGIPRHPRRRPPLAASVVSRVNTMPPPVHLPFIGTRPPAPFPTGAAFCPANPALRIRTGHVRPVCIRACPDPRTMSLPLSSTFSDPQTSTQQMSSPVRSDTTPSMYRMLPSPSLQRRACAPKQPVHPSPAHSDPGRRRPVDCRLLHRPRFSASRSLATRDVVVLWSNITICPPASTAGGHRSFPSAVQLQQLAITITPHLPTKLDPTL